MSLVLVKAITAGGVRAFSVLIALLTTIVVSRALGAEEGGLFLLGFTLMTVLSTVLRLGLDGVLIRAFGAHGINSVSLELLGYAFRWCALSTTLAVFVGVNFSEFISMYVFGKPAYEGVFFWMILSLPFVVFYHLYSFSFQGLQLVISATIFQQLGNGSIFLVVFSMAWMFFPDWLTAEYTGLLFFISSLVVFFIAVISWGRASDSGFSITPLKLKNAQLWKASSNFWISQSMSLMVQWSGVLIAGAMLDVSQLAYLIAAQRVASVVPFALVVVNMAVAPRYARLWNEGKLDELRALARVSTRGLIVAVIPVVGLMAFFPELLLKLFGSGFEQGALLLVILSIGQFINVATGSVGYLLNMSGHEKDLRRVSLVTGPASILLVIILTSILGATGTALATALGIAFQNIGALVFVKRRLGFWPIT